MELLSGHVSAETALVVSDYPYGFRLRCSIRYWLEVHPRLGVRLVSQTTNPKKGGVWNKAKFSTYAKISGAMFLDVNNHVQWSALSEYGDLEEAENFKRVYGEGVPLSARKRLDDWIYAKRIYEDKKAAGLDLLAWR